MGALPKNGSQLGNTISLIWNPPQKKTMYWALPFVDCFILTCCFLTRELCINHYFVLYLLLELLHVLQYVCICNYITSLNRSLEITFRKKSIFLQEISHLIRWTYPVLGYIFKTFEKCAKQFSCHRNTKITCTDLKEHNTIVSVWEYF